MQTCKQEQTYNLCSTERIYLKETLISYYFAPTKKKVKQWKPIDINGKRVKINLLTGEIKNFKRKEIEQSISYSLRRTTILMNMLLAMNDFDWFCTLTFDPQKIDRTNDEVVFNCYTNYINNLKKQFPDFRYMTFPEQHEDGCYHFHLLIGGLTPSQMGLVNSGKVCCHWAKKKNKLGILEGIGYSSIKYFERTKKFHELKETDGEPIYNVTTFAYGFTTVSRIVSKERCNSYVKKYVEKALGSTKVFKKRFYYSKNLNTPEIVKRLIGADFDEPKDIDKVGMLLNDPIIKNSKSEPYISRFNVMQVKIDNELKYMIDNGFIPAEKQELLFDENQQLTLEDELF